MINQRRLKVKNKRILLLALVLSLLAVSTMNAEPVLTSDADTVATSSVRTSKWVHTRGGDPVRSMLNVWRDINLQRCLEDYRELKVHVTDSLAAKAEPGKGVRSYQPILYTLTQMMDYRRFHPEGYSSRLTIYFYAAAALFLVMLICWLVKSFIISPFKK